ncbi:hypothetical protein CTA1_8080 [Colletotrichum tanaceti]|uniref:Uncharacterized protein n=1 Tax=Colletotrichum tanaceti TaxID=1306861 RepID=A0A4V6DGU1_9PEZI|nr:hypothetical protein CTA1_8080 [Colletotrichum tanaceti]
MLVWLNDIPEASALSKRPVLPTMAPNPLCLAWREQIMDNLRLISGRSALIDVYTSRHPNKSYTIYAVKVHRGKRQEILSATGRDLEDAFENLHTKSSQEVYQFIDANGFAFPRGVRSVSGRHEDDGSDSSDSEASTVDASDILSVSAVSDDSDDDKSKKRAKKTKGSSHRKTKRKTKRRSKHRDSSSSEEEEVDSDSGPEISLRRHRAAVAPIPRPSYIPTPPGVVSHPPPPPPGWRGPPARVYPLGVAAGPPHPPIPSFPPGMRPQPSQGLAAPTAPVVRGAPAAPSKPVRLIIKWRGHGEKKVIETCVASHRALQRTALAHVRSHWQTFENVIPQEMTPGRLWGLGAKVRRVALGKDLYAISAAGGDDLGMYFKAEDIPKFEVEVDQDGSIMPPPPPHPHSQQ